MIDINFDFYTDTPTGGDPDALSPTLRRYHQLLWSKELPNGERFDLSMDDGKYLSWKDFSMSSDAISNSYRHRTKMATLIDEVKTDADELFKVGSKIGAYIIFPSYQVNRKNTINQARGVIRKIDDRFDLTLECIRRFYLGEESPLSDCLDRYRNYFDLFVDFKGYVDFFLLQDHVCKNYDVVFYLPFDNFERQGTPKNAIEYREFKEASIGFIKARAQRIAATLPSAE